MAAKKAAAAEPAEEQTPGTPDDVTQEPDESQENDASDEASDSDETPDKTDDTEADDEDANFVEGFSSSDAVLLLAAAEELHGDQSLVIVDTFRGGFTAPPDVVKKAKADKAEAANSEKDGE